jgi:PAS domain S-box-containing protein
MGAATRARLMALARAALRGGVRGDQPPDLVKRIELCNVVALLGWTIMTIWALLEVLVGDPANLKWEIGTAFGFSVGFFTTRAGWHNASRLLVIAVANATVLLGAVLFPPGSGGTLPFLAMAGIPLLLFRPSEAKWLVAGVLIPAVLFVACETGALASWLGLEPKSAPSWYFPANALSTFALAFVLPLFFYLSNVRAETELDRLAQRKLKRLIDSSIIGVARGRMGRPIDEANDALLDLLGFTRDDLTAGGVDLGALTPTEYQERTRNAIALLMKTGTGPVYEKEYMRKDGTRVPVLVGMTMLDATTRETVGFVLDMTAQKHSQHTDELLRASQEAVRARDIFNSIASHELRTPLSVLTLELGFALAQLERGDAERDVLLRLVRRADASAKKLVALMDTVLDVSSLAQGRLELSMREMDLVQTTRTVIASFEAGLLCAPGQIAIEAPVPVLGAWDAVRMDQVVTNLLSNAVKYGDKKPIEIRVENGADGVARLEVTDRGIGIAPDMLEKIFDPFQRAIPVGTRIEGSGLGLHVVRSIVESHGGTIRVDSRRGVGTRFCVELPRRPPESTVARAELAALH